MLGSEGPKHGRLLMALARIMVLNTSEGMGHAPGPIPTLKNARYSARPNTAKPSLLALPMNANDTSISDADMPRSDTKKSGRRPVPGEDDDDLLDYAQDDEDPHLGRAGLDPALVEDEHEEVLDGVDAHGLLGDGRADPDEEHPLERQAGEEDNVPADKNNARIAN